MILIYETENGSMVGVLASSIVMIDIRYIRLNDNTSLPHGENVTNLINDWVNAVNGKIAYHKFGSLEDHVRSIKDKEGIFNAVKFIKEHTDMNLKEAKDYVDNL